MKVPHWSIADATAWINTMIKRKAVEVLFGETPPAIVGIAIMSDADNTGEQATAWYGDLVLTADQ